MVLITVPVGLEKLSDYMGFYIYCLAKCLDVGEHAQVIAVMIVHSVRGERSQSPDTGCFWKGDPPAGRAREGS